MATKRKSLSKKTRFEVFKRDKFACQYCGIKSPEAVLTVDHVHPVSKGGANNPLNLITACGACNAGKSDRTLGDDSMLEKQRRQLEELAERREQIEMMLEWQRGLVSVDDDAVEAVCKFYVQLVPGYCLNDKGRADVRAILRAQPLAIVLEELRGAVAKHVRCDEKNRATAESSEIATRVFLNSCKYRSQREKDPVGSELRYIRGILRNRITYCNPPVALELLHDAHAAGASLADLRRLAMSARSWSQWRDAMLDLCTTESAT